MNFEADLPNSLSNLRAQDVDLLRDLGMNLTPREKKGTKLHISMAA